MMSDTITRARRSASPTLDGERVVIVGPGRVGRSLHRWLTQRGARIVALAGRRPISALDGDGQPSLELTQLETSTPWRPIEELRSDDADLLILAVSDPALETVTGELADRPQAPVVLHVSGHFDAEALAPLRPACEIGSWHPLRAFTGISKSADEARDVTFAIDGEPAAVALANRLTAALGGQAIVVSDASIIWLPAWLPAASSPCSPQSTSCAAGPTCLTT